jgi:phosphoglycerol transferase MdoB-like AlkP superfamily enzyme
LNILSASRYGTGKTAELVLNTPFTILKTYGKRTVEEVSWIPPEEAQRLAPVVKKPVPGSTFRRKNVVVLILEGMGKEYIGSLNAYAGYTPFLDTLIRQSLVFPNAYANSKRSIEGIPAIVAGLPALMYDPFITSAYSGNSVTSLASLLKQEGYASIFFHGGTNGTMGFDNFSRLAGFDRYFGRTEYHNDADFDGSWGIYDEPFLRRAAQELNQTDTPFVAALFTLSSHHPYSIPPQYKDKFPQGTLPIHPSIGYADYSLKRFFEEASRMPWFSHTLFVITADHTALSEYGFYRNHVGLFSIPVIYYAPGDSLTPQKNFRTTQQIDILPSVMDYLGYDKPFFALGESVFDKEHNGYSIQFIDGTYQLIEDNYVLMMDTIRRNSLFDFVADSLLLTNLAARDSIRENEMESKLKSVVQQYNRALVHNEMKINP